MSDSIDISADSRIQHRNAVLNGQNYHYLYAEPTSGVFNGTVFLIHGWPDLSMGWRHQIPLLLDLDYRVVVPDLMGFGGTDAPQVPPEDLRLYSLKRAADDIAALAKELDVQNVVLGGHDWGGFVAWRTAQWHPDLISHVFVFCTPYVEPREQYIPLENLIAGPLPQFAYQLHLASGEVEKIIKDEDDIRQFLKSIYGGTGPNGESAFSPEKGVLGENLSLIGDGGLLKGKELEYYVKAYSKHGIHPTLNWYRTRRVNYEDDLALLGKEIINQPALFVEATRDSVLKPELSKGMESFIPNLTRGEVAASHWVLVQKPDEANQILRQWFEKQGLVTAKSSL